MDVDPRAIPAVDALIRTTPDAGTLLVAALLVALAWIGGLLVDRLLGRRLQTWAVQHFARHLDGFAARICPLVRYVTTALLLVAFSGIPGIGPLGRLLLAASLGLAAALAVFHVERGFRLGAALSASLAFVLLVAIVAGQLGGLEPLFASLDRASVRLGRNSISALDILNAAIVGALLFGAVRLINRISTRWIGEITALDLSQRVLFQKVAAIAVVTVAFFIGIDLLGIDLTALAVFSGAFGLAVGFGLQKTFGNLIAGLILLMDRSIKPGDVIVVGDTFGWVNKIGVRYVSVLTRDGKEHLIPNEKLMTEPVENWSYTNKNVRIHIPVGIAHDCDIRLAQRLMIDAAREHPRVLDNPAPVCWLRKFGLDAFEHELRVWIDDPEQGVSNVQGEILNRVWELFKANGIRLPYAQQDVYIRAWPEGGDPRPR